MAEQFQQTRDTAARKTDETAQFGQEKTGQAQQHAKGVGQTAQDKAHQAGAIGQEKMGQVKEGASNATGTAQQKAVDAKNNTGNMLQQAGDRTKQAATGAVDKVKGAFSSDNVN